MISRPSLNYSPEEKTLSLAKPLTQIGFLPENHGKMGLLPGRK
jgi:hypothetical protein